MSEIDTKNAKTPLTVTPLATAKEKIIYTYGGYHFNNSDKECEKILNWFTNHLAISNEQAVLELKIGNLPKRISELRKRGCVIFGKCLLVEVTHAHTYHSMVYALHRDMRALEQMPNPYRETNAWAEKVNSLLPNYPKFVDVNSEFTSVSTISVLKHFIQKMQEKCFGVV